MDQNVAMMLQAIALNDISEAREYARHFLGSPDLPDDFRHWLSPRLQEDSSIFNPNSIPPEIATLVVCEDVKKTFNPRRYWVSKREKVILDDIIALNEYYKLLADTNISILNSTMLFGNSGTGKTQFGRYVAYTLDLPFVYVNLCNLVGGQLGETGRNLGMIFDFAQKFPCVFMLDELDAIGTNRGSIGTGGTGDEMTRTTIALMQSLDRVRRDIVILAASNRADFLDEAVRRRFSAFHKIETFMPDESYAMIVNYLTDVNESGNLGLTWDEADIRSQCQIGKSQAKMIDICNRAIVHAVRTDDRRIQMAAAAKRIKTDIW